MDIFSGASSILLLNYNNYYNRIIKQESSVTAYIEAAEEYGTFINQNFPPKDGLSTSIVLNTEINQNGLSNYSGNFTDINNGNYVVVFDPLTYIIKSRWFILDMDQIRKGQYRVALKRDVIVDYYNSIMEAESYIEKAYVNTSDVAIYNSEDIAFNQIKKSETKLTDKTSQAWIVGYFNDITKLLPENQDHITISIPDRKVNQDITVDSLATWKYYQYTNLGGSNSYRKVNNDLVKVKVLKEELPAGYSYHIVDTDGNLSETTQSGKVGLELSGNNINDFKNWMSNNKASLKQTIYNNTTYGNDNIKSLNGKIIYDSSTQKYYNIAVNRGTTGSSSGWENINTVISINITTACVNSGLVDQLVTTIPYVGYDVNYTTYTLTLTELSESTLSFDLYANTNKLTDAPYKMFAIPWNGGSIFLSGSPFFIGSPKPTALQIAVEIARVLGTYLIDLQLLPYCPVLNTITDGGSIDITDLTVNKDFNLVKDSNTPANNVAIILYPTASNFSLDIDYSITLPTDPIEVKAVGDCDMYRLCSPNYAASFEFNPVKTGNITSFNVDCTYKPFAPYIKINPNWKGLYGDDFNDTRGLILSGDFSLPIINDQWIQYQINNKNYLNAFNRNIESVELRNKFALIGDIANAATGTVGAAAQGGWAGGIASGVAGAADVAINQYLRKDALDLTKDQFNYSLENIKALPNTLAKVSSFDYNNKIFPLIEFYSCTDQEREAYRNKLIYNGMKVMRIDKIKNFITDERHYIKAKIIRINVCCNHLANEIANELNMGVYL